MMGRFPKDAVTRVFEGLGSGRVARALGHPQLEAESWNTCFLALAYGEPKELERRMVVGETLRHPIRFVLALVAALRHVAPRHLPDFEARAAKILRLNARDTETFVRAFDDGDDRPELMALATEWLEQNRTTRNAQPTDSPVPSLEGATP